MDGDESGGLIGRFAGEKRQGSLAGQREDHLDEKKEPAAQEAYAAGLEGRVMQRSEGDSDLLAGGRKGVS